MSILKNLLPKRDSNALLPLNQYGDGIVFVTTVLRESNKKELTGYLYKIDWKSQNIEKQIRIPLNTGHPFWSNRGGNRGGRGIVYYSDYLYVATAMSILVYDVNLNLQREINSPFLAGLHEIDIYDNILWCTSTIHDEILGLSVNGDLKYKWEGHKDKIILEHFSLQNRTINYSFDASNSTPHGDSIPQKIEKYIQSELYHINSISVSQNGIYTYASKINSLLRIHPKPSQVVITDSKLEKSAHNFIQLNDGTFIVNDTRNQRIKLYSSEGRTTKIINTRHSYTYKSSQFSKGGWQRGLSQINNDVFLVGTSPARVFEVNIKTGKIGNSLLLDNNVKHCVHGVFFLSVT